MVRLKIHVFEDTGAPIGSDDYTTLIIFHGLAWHSGIFTKLLPLAQTHNTRLVLVNRRDYPGSEPYTPEERAVLQSCAVPPSNDSIRAENKAKLETFMKDRAREIYDFLENLVANDDIPAADKKNNTGGIVLVGWSFAVFWIFALLGNVETFPVNDVELEKYVRRIVCHDPGCRVLGYFPEGVVWDPYSPLFDSTIPQDKMADALDEWLSGYFVHGQTLDTLERRRWLMDPSPTATRLTPDELAAVRYRPVVAPDGSETLLIQGAIHAGVCGPIKNAALYFPSTSIHSESSEVSGENAEPAGNVWRGVEVRFLECTQTVWEGPYIIMTLQEEMDAARKKGVPTRDVRTVRVGGNHFVHWDRPEVAMRAFLGNEDVVE